MAVKIKEWSAYESPDVFPRADNRDYELTEVFISKRLSYNSKVIHTNRLFPSRHLRMAEKYRIKTKILKNIERSTTRSGTVMLHKNSSWNSFIRESFKWIGSPEEQLYWATVSIIPAVESYLLKSKKVDFNLTRKALFSIAMVCMLDASGIGAEYPISTRRKMVLESIHDVSSDQAIKNFALRQNLKLENQAKKEFSPLIELVINHYKTDQKWKKLLSSQSQQKQS